MPVAIKPMEPETFARICALVYESSGISLGPKKEALVVARVGKRIRALGLGGYEEYLDYLEEDESEVIGLLNAVSTNVTSFFREPHHFEHTAEVAKRAYDAGQRRFRYWSCACSSGEESYSLAMTLREALPYPDADVRILATDISTQALDACAAGYYELSRIAPVPQALRERWFRRQETEGGERWRVKTELRRMVVVRRMNLAKPPFPMHGPLDAVFCRNVMIYFDDVVRFGLLAEAHRLLASDGLLYVGHAESLAGMIADFRFVAPSIYRRA